MLKKQTLLALSISSAIFLAGCNNNNASNTDVVETETVVSSEVMDSEFEATENVHYEVLEEPIASQNNEIIEFIWYQCGHCYTAEQVMMAKAGDLQEAGAFIRKEHALLSRNWVPDGRLFYALKALGVEKEATGMIFDYYHNEDTQWDQNAIFEEVGVTEEAVMEIMNSDEVREMMSQSTQDARKAGVTGTPTFVVQGKYKITTQNIRSYEHLIDIAIEITQKYND